MAARRAGGQAPGGGLSSVSNAIRLLKSFSDEQSELGISDLAVRLGLAKSTVHRLASTLLNAGMLEQNRATNKYRLGLAVFELGSLVRRKLDWRFEAQPWLVTLRDQTGETVDLSILDHGGVVCVNALEGPRVDPVRADIGVRKPLHCTAEGKVLMAFQVAALIECSMSAGLEPRTPQTLIDPAALRQELAAIRARGYATDDEEYEIGVRSIAAAVRDEGGNPIAAVGVTGPAERLTRNRLLELAPCINATAEAISAHLRQRGRAGLASG